MNTEPSGCVPSSLRRLEIDLLEAVVADGDVLPGGLDEIVFRDDPARVRRRAGSGRPAADPRSRPARRRAAGAAWRDPAQTEANTIRGTGHGWNYPQKTDPQKTQKDQRANPRDTEDAERCRGGRHAMIVGSWLGSMRCCSSRSAVPRGWTTSVPFSPMCSVDGSVPPARVEEVAHHYELFGGVSPITAFTKKQAEGLQARLARAGAPLPVFVGMRNWHPFLPTRSERCRTPACVARLDSSWRRRRAIRAVSSIARTCAMPAAWCARPGWPTSR